MDLIHIAELHPELSARDSKQFKAAVTLIWPYSSSQREFALLLAEPEFRLRRKKGQVRARFSGSSARALATTGVGIGDEVVLSLRGAQFIQDGSVSTPGKSIDWELEYTQDVVVQVFRDGNEIANLELLDAAPTPAPRSPIRQQTTVSDSPAQQWSSPAFLKRVRLSDGPIFEAPYDTLVDENGEGHDKKRRRKSYRDWKAWTYSARTPSPEKDDAGTEDDLESMEASPSRKTQLPHTPLSPTRNGMLSIAAGPFDGSADMMDVAELPATKSITTITNTNKGDESPAPDNDDFVRDNDYYDLYAGPDEARPTDAEYAFGGDTEANTEDEVLEDTDVASLSPTEVDTVDLGEHQEHRAKPTDGLSDTDDLALVKPDAGSTTEEGSLIEMPSAGDLTASDDKASDEPQYPERVEEVPMIIMPPPTLPTLDTSFQAPSSPEVRTPIGKEPSSPTLKPLDSALLPLPSPFPGERDMNITSYLDHVPVSEQQVEPEAEEDDTSYIMENSFFSSIGSSKANPLHPYHESAFTPVRFTFGMDGAGFSKPLEISSPAPEYYSGGNDNIVFSEPKASDLSSTAPETTIEEVGEVMTSGPEASDARKEENREDLDEMKFGSEVGESHIDPVSSPLTKIEASFTGELVSEDINEDNNEDTNKDVDEDAEDLENIPKHLHQPKYTKTEPEIIELSSDSEEDLEESEEEVGLEESEEGNSEGSEEENSEESEEEGDSGEDEEEYDIRKDDAMAVERIDSDTLVPAADEKAVANHTSDSHRLSPRDFSAPTSSNKSTGASAVVDLGPPSGSSDVEEELNGPEAEETKASDETEGTPSKPQVLKLLSDDDLVETGQNDNHSEFIAMDFVPAFSDTAAAIHEKPSTHSSTQQDMQTAAEHSNDSQPLVVDGLEFLQAMGDQDTFMEDNLIQDDSFDMGHWQGHDMEEHHPDVKLESIEAGSMFQTDELDTRLGQNTYDESNATGDILIEVPEEGSKVGELQTVAVPATGPARNTRSKAKSSDSPTKEDSPSLKRTTRSTRSKASATSVARTTMSPSQEAHQTSPYSLRSQSKLLSPTKSVSVSGTATRRSPRKHASQRSMDSIPDVGSQLQNLDPFLTGPMPSQDLGASQRSRNSDVLAVKDSEEESLHSEHSISTVKYVDDWNIFTNFSDPSFEPEHDQNVANLKQPPSTAPEPRSRTGKTIDGKKSEFGAIGNNPPRSDHSFVTQPAPMSPSRMLRSASRNESSSPRVLRTTGRSQHNISSSPRPMEDLADERTPRSKIPAYLDLKGESKSNEPRYSPGINEGMRSSPPAVAATFPPHNQHSIFDSNKMMTPEATQQTNIESQHSMVTSQPQQTLPITPQLTQGTSAGLRSLNDSMTAKVTVTDPNTVSSPTLITKSTPRRNTTQTDVASPSTTPKAHSPDASSDADTTAVDKPAGPSIGLSTPLAYYTPLNALPYFLNRSSQFHTSSNPDILALVTSPTTPAVRATKGRKDWTTTLHITDASAWPASTTVSIFRPYQTALPIADAGDVVLLRAFAVKSLNRKPTLTSADESAWCVWRYGKPVWSRKKGVFGEVKAREEVKGPLVESGEGEWREVEVLRGWWAEKVKGELEGGKDKDEKIEEGSGVKTRSRSAKKQEEMGGL
jgi:hypothetical protein